MADDFQSGICNGSWWNAARSGGFDATAMPMTTAPPISCSISGGSEEAFNWAAATAEPAGSASGSSVTYQDNTPMMASAMDWNQALLSNGRPETSFHAMLHQDLSTTSPFFRQDPSIDLSMNPFKEMNQSLINQHHLSSDVAPPAGMVPASSENYQPAIMGYQGIPTELSQPSSWPGFTQLIDASPPPMQQSRDQPQFSGSTPFWNSLGSARSMDSSGFYPLMTTQFPPQSMEQKSSSSRSNFNMKSSSKGARDSSSSTAKKNNVSEPAMKKPRIETPSPLPTFKVRKEKLGDRVTALQQLVSPFGKTDTASVLHETIDYIKFLHDQVKALSAPYLKNGHPMQHQQINPNESNDEEGPEQDLKSRGLCLVPVASTYPVASEIPADFWTPTFGGLFSCNSGNDESTFPKMLQEDLSSRGAYFNQGISMNSDQINTSNQGSLVNSLKDIKQPFLDCGFKSHPVAQTSHGHPTIAMQDLFSVEAEARQSDHANRRSVGYQSQVTVIAGA